MLSAFNGVVVMVLFLLPIGGLYPVLDKHKRGIKLF